MVGQINVFGDKNYLFGDIPERLVDVLTFGGSFGGIVPVFRKKHSRHPFPDSGNVSYHLYI